METKKNPKKDLTRDSGMHFVTGLAAILMLTYVALEWKMFYGDTIKGPTVMVDKEDITEDPFVLNLPPPPPPVIIDPPVLKVVPDIDDIPETDVVVSEPIDAPIIAVDSVPYIKLEEDVLIPIGTVEFAPIFPGCENAVDKITCFNTMMQKHVVKNFRYPESAIELDIEGKVHVMFVIQKDGTIGNLRLRGPDKMLENEAARIIGKLPQMTPGKQGVKNVRVPFSVPITFQLGH